jgi:predicted CXXCH cytochrome family protein
MKSNIALTLAAVLIFLLAGAAVSQADKFKLKTGAMGQLCLTCHVSFQEKMKKKHLHTPLANGECTGCHNPHTSTHGKLMAADPKGICFNCHDRMAPDRAASVHQDVAAGNCTACHDPHAADNKANLVRAGSKLCFGCHEELGKKIGGNKFAHAPVAGNCLSCHTPHASAKNPRLLIADDPALCLKCHQTGGASFKKVHLNYPVEKGRCTSCHNPHGSSTRAILYDNVHPPVSNKMCGQCHAEATAAKPFELKSTGFQLCQGCHYDMMNDALNAKRLHWPLVDSKGCINCHSPHASPEPGLLKKPQLKLCGDCHGDTVARQERAPTKHPPIADGECSSCHSPHGSDNLFILNKPSVIEVCSTCHEWQTHSTHPIGEKVIDPRNKNLTLQCLSCHRTHGTEYKHFIYFDTVQELCVQCHTQFRR